MQPVNIEDYPQLKSIAWNLKAGTLLDPEEALSLYEVNRRFMGEGRLTEGGRGLVWAGLSGEAGDGAWLLYIQAISG